MNCFANFPNFTEYFSNNIIVSFLTDFKRDIGINIFYSIQKLKSSNREEIDDALYELRKSLTKAGLDIKKDNVEIDPGDLISFFIRKLNSELNEVIFNVLDSTDISQYIILSSSFKFLPGQEEFTFNQIINIYNKKLLSLMSRNFFNTILTRRQCNNCGSIGLYFSMMHFVPLNVDILSKKGINLTVRNAITCLCNDKILLNLDKNVKCDFCKIYTAHCESKKFYHTAKNLIIVFDRGNNFKNNTFVDFDEKLILNSTEVYRYKEVKYILLGIISKVENKDNQGDFISYNSIGNSKWVSNRDKNNIISFDNVKKRGTVISLFYYCYDDNMILQSVYSKNSFENISNIVLSQQMSEIKRKKTEDLSHPFNNQFSGVINLDNNMANSTPSQGFNGMNNMMGSNNNNNIFPLNSNNNIGNGFNNIDSGNFGNPMGIINNLNQYYNNNIYYN